MLSELKANNGRDIKSCLRNMNQSRRNWTSIMSWFWNFCRSYLFVQFVANRSEVPKNKICRILMPENRSTWLPRCRSPITGWPPFWDEGCQRAHFGSEKKSSKFFPSEKSMFQIGSEPPCALYKVIFRYIRMVLTLWPLGTGMKKYQSSMANLMVSTTLID